MSKRLTQAQLNQLRKFTTPTICNAIEMFRIRRRNEGFMTPEVVCRFPDIGPMIGYAVTATHRAREEAQPSSSVDMNAYYEYILSQSAPRLLVSQDLDDPPVGALFGEVNATIHKALGCVGHITNGGVRDLDECHRIGFQYFSKYVLVSHAYVHLESFGQPIRIGGIMVRPGDLIHADQHGICLSPHTIALELAAACRTMEALERPLIKLARSPSLTPAKLTATRATMRKKFEEASKRFAQAATETQ